MNELGTVLALVGGSGLGAAEGRGWYGRRRVGTVMESRHYNTSENNGICMAQ
jgi:hypothetical protein